MSEIKKPWELQLIINRRDRRIIKQQEEITELKAKLDKTVMIKRIPLVNYDKWFDTPLIGAIDNGWSNN